jgi:hypothetical protein
VLGLLVIGMVVRMAVRMAVRMVMRMIMAVRISLIVIMGMGKWFVAMVVMIRMCVVMGKRLFPPRFLLRTFDVMSMSKFRMPSLTYEFSMASFLEWYFHEWVSSYQQFQIKTSGSMVMAMFMNA